MIVIADTSPLNYLIRLGHPDVLREIYGRELVPHAVVIEMQHPEAPVEVRDWASAPPSWLEEVHVRQIDTSLAVELGPEEREAISLALEVQADVLLIDERAGRQEAEARHIAVAGTLAVLLQAFPAWIHRFSRNHETTAPIWVPRFAALRSVYAGPI